MRYFFESKVEKKEKGYAIPIPFNIWEVCKQRDVIKAEVVLDNNIIDGNLLPIEKGNHEIHIDDEDAVSVELGVTHKISARGWSVWSGLCSNAGRRYHC